MRKYDIDISVMLFVEAFVVLCSFNRSDYHGDYDYDNTIAHHDESDGNLKFNLWIELTK